jgi:hypothetical protein
MTPPLARAAQLAALIGSAALGWSAHEATTPAAAPAVVLAPAPPVAKAAPLPEAPLIAVASDGNVTLRVEQQPLDWVLEQIALQSGRTLAAAPAAAQSATTTAAPALAAPPSSPPSAPPAAAPPVDDTALRLAQEREAAEQLAAVQQGQHADVLPPLVDP